MKKEPNKYSEPQDIPVETLKSLWQLKAWGVLHIVSTPGRIEIAVGLQADTRCMEFRLAADLVNKMSYEDILFTSLWH